jgi:hypothetical protein
MEAGTLGGNAGNGRGWMVILPLYAMMDKPLPRIYGPVAEEAARVGMTVGRHGIQAFYNVI